MALTLAVLAAWPAAAQTSTTNCVNLGAGLSCTTTTPPDYGADVRARNEAFLRQQQQLQQQNTQNFNDILSTLAQRRAAQQAPRSNVAPQQAYSVVQGFNEEHRCGEGARYAAEFGDQTLIAFALKCEPSKAQ